MADSPENPAAFPHESYDAEVDMDTVKPGMTLRDWFAGKALACIPKLDFGCAGDECALADGAYLIADAMLARRAYK